MGIKINRNLLRHWLDTIQWIDQSISEDIFLFIDYNLWEILTNVLMILVKELKE